MTRKGMPSPVSPPSLPPNSLFYVFSLGAHLRFLSSPSSVCFLLWAGGRGQGRGGPPPPSHPLSLSICVCALSCFLYKRGKVDRKGKAQQGGHFLFLSLYKRGRGRKNKGGEARRPSPPPLPLLLLCVSSSPYLKKGRIETRRQQGWPTSSPLHLPLVCACFPLCLLQKGARPQGAHPRFFSVSSLVLTRNGGSRER